VTFAWSTEEAANADEASDLVAVFANRASFDAVRVAWVVAAAIALPTDDVHAAVAAAGFDSIDIEGGFRELQSWPVVQHGSDGWRVTDVLSEPLVAAFQEHEAGSGAFLRVYEHLVERERRREAEANEDEVWYVRGRLAFYLAGLASEQSVAEFGARFSDAPVLDRTAARVWLSSLALGQRRLLRDHERELMFFHAFKLYVAGRRQDALKGFETVIGSFDDSPTVESLPQRDRFTAISLHLAAAIFRRQRPAVATDYLRLAVELSELLGLRENEVMSRQTLVWNVIERANRSEDAQRQVRYEEAFRLALQNVEAARLYEDPYLVFWTEHTAIESEWLFLTDARRSFSGAAREKGPELARRLIDIADELRAMKDLESAALAANSAASIYRDLGNYEAALAAVEGIVTAIGTNPVALSGYVRLGKTTGSILARRDVAGSTRNDAKRLLSQLHQVIDPSGSQAAPTGTEQAEA
jgi:hypothetical protein